MYRIDNSIIVIGDIINKFENMLNSLNNMIWKIENE